MPLPPYLAPQWTPEEIARLGELYPDHSNEEIAAIMGAPRQASKYGLSGTGSANHRLISTGSNQDPGPASRSDVFQTLCRLLNGY